MEHNEEWCGWKDIKIPIDLVGDEITKGKGMWEKNYTYIKIPQGYGYDGYCFLLSSRCVHFAPFENSWWFSICHDMNIDLIYDVELREEGKRYKRFKLSGRELFNSVFKDYEVNFAKECEERIKREQLAKEKLDKSIMGKIVCAKYEGNFYPDDDFHYLCDSTFKAYFIGDNQSTYCNHKFKKVRNVKVKFVIFDNISRYQFFRCETIINAYLSELDTFMSILRSLRSRLSCRDTVCDNKILMKCYPEYLVRTNTEDIFEKQIAFCEKAISDVKTRLHERIDELLSYDVQG